MSFIDTILEEAHQIFKKEGITTFSEEELINRLDIHAASYRELFTGKADLLSKAILHDLERREQAHKQALAAVESSIEGIMYLLQDGISYIKEMHPKYIADMQLHYPQVWQLYQSHINTHYYYQISEILNAGIVQGALRKDINIKLVAKIIIEQINMLLNPMLFPPDQYDLIEVFRSIFFYYLRGLCTASGGKMAEELFSKYRL